MSTAEKASRRSIVVTNLIQSSMGMPQPPIVPGPSASADGPRGFATALQTASGPALMAFATVSEKAAGNAAATTTKHQSRSATQATEKTQGQGPTSPAPVAAPLLVAAVPPETCLVATVAAVPTPVSFTVGDAGTEETDKAWQSSRPPSDSVSVNSVATGWKTDSDGLAITPRVFPSRTLQMHNASAVSPPGQIGAKIPVAPDVGEGSPNPMTLQDAARPQNQGETLLSQWTAASDRVNAIAVSPNVSRAAPPIRAEGQSAPVPTSAGANPTQFLVSGLPSPAANEEAKFPIATKPELAPASSPMPAEAAMPTEDSSTAAGPSQPAGNDDPHWPAARFSPSARIVSRPAALGPLGTQPAAGKRSAALGPQTENSIQSAETKRTQNSPIPASAVPFGQDSTKTASPRSQVEGSSPGRSGTTDDFVKSSHQPPVREGDTPLETATSSANAAPANTPPVTASGLVPAQKVQSESGQPLSAAASLVASVPSATGRDAGNQGLTSGASAPPSSPPAPSLPTADAVSTGVVQVARLVEGMSKAEMHIDLRTQDFGSVEVHTVLRESQLGLAVGSEKGDLRVFLTPEVPSLQAVIHQQDLRFDAVRFLDHNSQSSAAFAGGADPQSRGQNRGQSPSPVIPSADPAPNDPLPDEISLEPSMSLSVHA